MRLLGGDGIILTGRMFSKLFGSKKKTSGTDVPVLSDSLNRTILSSLGMKSIPVMSQAAQQTFQLATNPKADAHDFIEVIEADEGLSARILKVANSVYYDRGGGSKTISDAVQVIGTSELRGLLNASTLSDIFSTKHKLRSQLWTHDIATALVAKTLAQRLLPSLTEQALLAGLMHDVGKLLMLQRHSDTYERITRKGVADGVESIIAEVDEYPFDHTHVGQLIAQKWNFTPGLTAAIRLHHEPWRDLDALSLAAVVKASNILAHTLALGEGKDPLASRRAYDALLPEAWEALRIGPTEQKTIPEEVRRAFDDEYELYASWGSG